MYNVLGENFHFSECILGVHWTRAKEHMRCNSKILELTEMLASGDRIGRGNARSHWEERGGGRAVLSSDIL